MQEGYHQSLRVLDISLSDALFVIAYLSQGLSLFF